MEDDGSPELGGPQANQERLSRYKASQAGGGPVPTFFAVTNCHHGDHHKKDSSQMQSFPGKFLPFSPLSLLGLHAPPPLDLSSLVSRGGGVCCVRARMCVCVCVCVYLKSPRLRRGWTQKRWACKPPPKTPGPQRPCSSAGRQSDGVSQGGLLSPLSLSVEWLTRTVSLSLSFSPSPPPSQGMGTGGPARAGSTLMLERWPGKGPLTRCWDIHGKGAGALRNLVFMFASSIELHKA